MDGGCLPEFGLLERVSGKEISELPIREIAFVSELALLLYGAARYRRMKVSCEMSFPNIVGKEVVVRMREYLCVGN